MRAIAKQSTAFIYVIFRRCLIISILAITFFACSTPKQKEFEHLEKYFKEVHNFTLDNKINQIFVITEGAGCSSCDKTFSKAVFEHSQSENSVFLISATGKFIDIQPYLTLDKNCFFDCEFNREDYPEFANSSVIFLKNHKVDTAVIINYNEIIQQLEYIENRK